jgi:hypothetical protein
LYGGFVVACPSCFSNKIFEVANILVDLGSFYIEILELSLCLFFLHGVHKGMCEFIAKHVPEPRISNGDWVNLSYSNIVEPFYFSSNLLPLAQRHE